MRDRDFRHCTPAMALIVALSAATGCDATSCTEILKSALRITVTPGPGVSCSDLEVTATDGDFTEQLNRFDCTFGGVGERPGTYDVRIEGHGRTLTIQHIVVTANICHVIPESRSVQFDQACTDAEDDAGQDDEDAEPAPAKCVVEAAS